MTTSPQDDSPNPQSPLIDSVRRRDSDGTFTASPLAQPETAPASITPQSNSCVLAARRDRNSQYPAINQLPTELLVAIFELCLEADPEEEFSPYAGQLHRLCAVCQLWSSLAQGTPALWRHVSVLDAPQHINKALDLSGSTNITVFYDGDVGCPISQEAFMALVEPHAARWDQAVIFGVDLDQAPVQVWESSNLSKLHTLDLRSSSEEHTRRISLGGEEDLPNLRVASFDNIHLHLHPGQLPGLRKLQLSQYGNPNVPLTILQLLHLLRGTPHLEELHLSDMEITADIVSGERFTLPDLSRLFLIRVNPDGAQQLLSSIRLPQFNQDRRRELPGEASNNPSDIPYYARDMDILGFQDNIISIRAGRLQFSVETRSVLQFTGVVLAGFADELASSQHIHARIEMSDRLGAAAVVSILDRLDQFPNFKSIHVTQYNGFTPLVTVIRLLGRSKVPQDSEVWYLPHLEAISIAVQAIPVLELAIACWERRSAAARSGRPKEIQQLHIGPLGAELEDKLKEEVESQMDWRTKQGLDHLQSLLGAGQLFWRGRPWTGGVNGDGSESSSYF